MPVKSMIKTTYLQSSCGAEDAELLLNWLLENPNGSVNMKKCTHVHAAVLQVLMAFQPPISVPPKDQSLQMLVVAAGLSLASPS